MKHNPVARHAQRSGAGAHKDKRRVSRSVRGSKHKGRPTTASSFFVFTTTARVCGRQQKYRLT